MVELYDYKTLNVNGLCQSLEQNKGSHSSRESNANSMGTLTPRMKQVRDYQLLNTC